MAANGNSGYMAEETRFNIGALQQRVLGLEDGLRGIASQIGALSSKIDERSRTPWSVIWGAAGVVVVVLGLIGGILYQPIKEGQARLEADQRDDRKALTAAVQSVGEKFVTRAELDARTARGQTDFARINQDIRALEAAQVPRAEHGERWRSIERDFANLQGQITQLRQDFGSTYSLKDALARMERELEYLKRGKPPA